MLTARGPAISAVCRIALLYRRLSSSFCIPVTCLLVVSVVFRIANVPISRAIGMMDTVVEAMAKSVARPVGSSVGRALIRGILGSLFGKGR
jgi:hypothetical protein